jgi:hypothetical protein
MTEEDPMEPDGPGLINGSTGSPRTAESERVLARIVPIFLGDCWKPGALTLAHVGDKE